MSFHDKTLNREMRVRSKIKYPTRAKIEQMVNAGRACGLDVRGFEVSPDGHIRVFEDRGLDQAENDFDRWDKKL